MDFSSLISGTDIRGIASNIKGGTVNLTDEAVYSITNAFVSWYINKFEVNPNSLTVAVGHDSRITAEKIKTQVINALVKSGVTVLDCGLSSTPAMFMTTVDANTFAAVQITASHHPCDRNGLKFFIKSGGLDNSDIKEIVELANDGESVIPEKEGSVKVTDFMSVYAKRLRKMICDGVGKTESDMPLKGYHIIVDAGNGAGGFYANDVLKPLGADISGSQFLQPDGMFPNHIPNPENKDAMESICNAVINSKADLGVIFDTDVDRAGCVGSDGKEINRNRLIALASYIAVNGQKDAYIVTDSVTSDGLKEYIENELSAKHYRYRRGYKNVINKAVELNNDGIFCPLAIETSGHAALKENYFLDDGAYLATKIIIELAKGQNIEKILKPLKMPKEEKECRLNILTDDFKTYGNLLIAELENYVLSDKKFTVADDNREGLRVSTSDGWFLLRLSVHDPVMPMNFESNFEGGVEKLIKTVKPFFENRPELDISSLKI